VLQNKRTPGLAVDLGGTKILAAVLSPDGKVISRMYCLTLANKGFEAIINRLLSVAGQVLAKAKLRPTDLLGIAIAAAGIIDVKKGIIATSPNLPGWHNVPLGKIVADKIGSTTYLINDASAAALGEHLFGVGQGAENMVYLTVSTGIGGGLIIGGELYLGADGCAGELGHITIEPHGPKCGCGNAGCLEVLASGTAMAREAGERIMRGEASYIVQLLEGNMENLTAEIVAAAARKGDQLACEVVAKAANYLGIGLANLVNIFNPDVIVIGGGVSKMGEMLLRPVRKVVKDRAFQLPARTVRIVRSRLGDDAGIIGAAAYLFKKQYVKL